MSNNNEHDRFQYWLTDMDEALERFKSTLPPKLAKEADFTLESLAQLEENYLEEFSSVEQAVLPASAQRVDGYARYLGETLRLLAGGKWLLDTSNPKNAFYGLPQIKGAFGSICPLTLVTAAADRRTGKYWTTVVGNQLARVRGG